MDNAHERNVDPKESSDASFNSIDNTENAKTQRDFDESKTGNVTGLRSYAPLHRCISSGWTEAFDVLSKTRVNPFCGKKGVGKANDLFHLISTSL